MEVAVRCLVLLYFIFSSKYVKSKIHNLVKDDDYQELSHKDIQSSVPFPADRGLEFRSIPYDANSVLHEEREYSRNGRKTIIFKNHPRFARRKREIIARKSLRVNPDITPPTDIDEKETKIDRETSKIEPEKKEINTGKPVIKDDKYKEEKMSVVNNKNVSRLSEAAMFRAFEIRKYKDMLTTIPAVEFRSKSKNKLRKSRNKKNKVSRHRDDTSEAEYPAIPKTVKLSKENKEFYDERKWPDNKVPYYISDNDKYDVEDVRNRLAEVNKILRAKTCVELYEIQEEEANKYEDYLVLDDSPDYVTGRVGGKQHFGVRELLSGGQHRQHAAMVASAMLGLYLESSRHDRDRYIRVHYRHIRPDKLHHFEKLQKDATFPLPYDYKSATHPAWQYWRHGGRTGIATVATYKDKDPDGSIMRELGQHEQLLSDYDVIKINSVYGVECFKQHKRKNHSRVEEEEDERQSREDDNREEEEDYT